MPAAACYLHPLKVIMMHNTAMQLCIVIPIYNHDLAFSKMLQEIIKYQYPCVLVNDGSDNDCVNRLQNIIKDSVENIVLLHHPYNQGKGKAVITGLRYAITAGYTHAIQIDADGQHNPGDIPNFVMLAEKYPNAIIAGYPRYDDSVPSARYYARYLTHIWVWIHTWSTTIKDSMCGFRLYPLLAMKNLIQQQNIGSRMDFDTDIIVRAYWQGIKIVNHETNVIYPRDGISHFRLLKDNVLITVMHTKLFFGMLWRIPMLIKRYLRSGGNDV